MIISRRIIFSVIVVLIFSNVVISQTVNQLSGQVNTITTAVPFLIIAPDARAGAMGDAGVSSTPDANSMHWNPAKYAFVEKDMGVAISYSPWLRALVPDINLAYLSAYKQINKKQTVAASLLYFSLGDITFTDAIGTNTGQFRPNEFSIDVAYSRKLSDDFSGGVALRYIYSNLTGGAYVGVSASHAGQDASADVSFYYQKKLKAKDIPMKLALGLDLSNIGGKISYTDNTQKDFIPINMRFGPSYTIDLDKYNTISVMVDFNKLLVPTPNSHDTLQLNNSNVSVASGIFNSFSDAPCGFKEELREFNIASGVEYWYDKQFAIRSGFFYEDKTKGNRKYFTVGAGVRYNVFGLDFAYLIPTEQRNPLENTLRFTL
ncbi:MAG: type IX secretion system outer membrane channel protein PorV, partial [Bacteroidota bacterium]|nr:type IX secretion system outer membrane channel protein PorV [Bacteroidota bacterium]